VALSHVLLAFCVTFRCNFVRWVQCSPGAV